MSQNISVLYLINLRQIGFVFRGLGLYDWQDWHVLSYDVISWSVVVHHLHLNCEVTRPKVQLFMAWTWTRLWRCSGKSESKLVVVVTLLTVTSAFDPSPKWAGLNDPGQQLQGSFSGARTSIIPGPPSVYSQDQTETVSPALWPYIGWSTSNQHQFSESYCLTFLNSFWPFPTFF